MEKMLLRTLTRCRCTFLSLCAETITNTKRAVDPYLGDNLMRFPNQDHQFTDLTILTTNVQHIMFEWLTPAANITVVYVI